MKAIINDVEFDLTPDEFTKIVDIWKNSHSSLKEDIREILDAVNSISAEEIYPTSTEAQFVDTNNFHKFSTSARQQGKTLKSEVYRDYLFGMTREMNLRLIPGIKVSTISDYGTVHFSADFLKHCDTDGAKFNYNPATVKWCTRSQLELFLKEPRSIGITSILDSIEGNYYWVVNNDNGNPVVVLDRNLFPVSNRSLKKGDLFNVILVEPN
jgi:hypothetical protein